MTKHLLLTALAAVLFTATPADLQAANKKAKPARWFEVEVILFTRDIPHDAIRESFDQEVKPITYRRTRDLLTPYHYPDIRQIFEAAGNCSIEQGLFKPEPQVPSYAQLEAQFAAQQPSLHQSDSPTETIDVAQLYNDAFVAPDLSQWFKPEPVGCDGLPVAFSWQQPWKFLTDNQHQDRSFNYHYDMYPRVINPGELKHNNYVHLMSPRNFKLREIYRTLRRQPDMRPILHTSWRQPGTSSGRSRATRLFAGIDYSEKYDFQGELKPNNPALVVEPSSDMATIHSDDHGVLTQPNSVVDNIERVLQLVDQGATVDYKAQKITSTETKVQTNEPQQVIEIDGLFRIYIDGFNYLHIDAEFNLRREIEVTNLSTDNHLQSLLHSTPVVDNQSITPQTRLANYHFKQTRRVISKQLHYFDHPYMGMIVQIRRHGW